MKLYHDSNTDLKQMSAPSKKGKAGLREQEVQIAKQVLISVIQT
jgi:hypothetical protein